METKTKEQKMEDMLSNTSFGNVDNIIDNIIKTNKVRRFASELNSVQSSDSVRAANIKKIMSVFSVIDVQQEAAKKTKLTEIYDKINTETLQWKWTKLSIPQQKDRIKEYLKRTVHDNKKRESAEKLLFSLADNGKLKSSSVTYDTNKTQITGIFVKEYQDIMQESESESESD